MTLSFLEMELPLSLLFPFPCARHVAIRFRFLVASLEEMAMDGVGGWMDGLVSMDVGREVESWMSG